MKLTIKKTNDSQCLTVDKLEGKVVRFWRGGEWYLILNNVFSTLKDSQMMPCMYIKTCTLCGCNKNTVPVEIRELEEIIIG